MLDLLRYGINFNHMSNFKNSFKILKKLNEKDQKIAAHNIEYILEYLDSKKINSININFSTQGLYFFDFVYKIQQL